MSAPAVLRVAAYKSSTGYREIISSVPASTYLEYLEYPIFNVNHPFFRHNARSKTDISHYADGLYLSIDLQDAIISTVPAIVKITPSTHNVALRILVVGRIVRYTRKKRKFT